MPMTDAERLRYLELKQKAANAVDTSYLSNQITPSAEPGEPSFFQGVKAGLTAQPGEGVGYFVGSALPAGVGGAFGGPVGAALGEAARQTMGAVANPEEAAKQSKLGLAAQVAGAGVMQKAGEVAGPYVGKGVKKVGELIGDFSDWVGTKIGNAFLKASKKINAYGHEPVQAIKDEKIMAGSWDSLIDKVKAKKQDVGQEIRDVLQKAEKDTITNIDDIVSPVDKALAEAQKFPTENEALIKRLVGLREDTLALLKRGSDKGQMLNSERANSIKSSLYKVTKYSGADADDIPLNKVKQDIARNIAKKIGEITPEVKPLMNRYSNLSALENAVTNRAVVASNSDMLGLKEAVLGTGSAAFGMGYIPGIGIGLADRSLRAPFGATPAINLATGVAKAARGVGQAAGEVAEEVTQRAGGAISSAALDIKARYKAGEISREEAAAELRASGEFK